MANNVRDVQENQWAETIIVVSGNANGNLLTESGDVNRTVTWTSYNKPSQITGNGAKETFIYGPDRSRLVTAITKGSDTVTTTYIDGLFEQVYDSAKGDWTYRHYILAGGARVGVETLTANSGGTITSDTLSFYVRDEVGSVIATVTENLGGANQSVALTSYGAWGKARPTNGSGAYQDLPAGSFSPTPAGQEEGYAGHDNLLDTGLVDMEGRVYDPEVGNFLSPDPNVQYPFSSQGYNRYIYVNDNPLSLSDPSGYFSVGGYLTTGDPLAGFFPQEYGEALSIAGPIVGAALNVVPGCQGWCDWLVTGASEAEAGYLETGSISDGLEAGVIAGAEAYAFTAVGDDISWASGAGGLAEKSFAEGILGGAFSSAGGGQFGDGFLGAFVSSESSGMIGNIDGGSDAPSAIAARAAVSAVVGGTVSRLTGGNFSDGAVAAAFQSLFNDEIGRERNEKLCGDPTGCIAVSGPGGQVTAWVPCGGMVGGGCANQGIAGNAWFQVQNKEPNRYNFCDSACWKRAGYITLTGVGLAAGGIGAAAEVGTTLAMDEASVSAFESISASSRGIAVLSGAGSFALHPTIERGLMVGAGAALLISPLPEVSVFAEMFLEGEEINSVTEHPGP